MSSGPGSFDFCMPPSHFPSFLKGQDDLHARLLWGYNQFEVRGVPPTGTESAGGTVAGDGASVPPAYETTFPGEGLKQLFPEPFQAKMGGHR
jgi:hypothetical protein